MASSYEILATAKRNQLELAGCGLFAQVIRVANTDIALKIPDEPGEADAIEKRIYERLGTHPLILQTYGEAESIVGKGLMLRYLDAGTVTRNIELEKFPQERKQWPIQAAEAVRYIHSKGVIHCDIGIHNFLIQNDGSLALADFCGSVLDGSEALVSTSSRYTRPLPYTERCSNQTEKDDLFALGTVLYEISVGHRLYAEKTDGEIYGLFHKQEFPDISNLDSNLRIVIGKCWRDQYSNAEEILSDLSEKNFYGFFVHFNARITNGRLCRFSASIYALIVASIIQNITGSIIGSGGNWKKKHSALQGFDSPTGGVSTPSEKMCLKIRRRGE